MLDSTNHLRCSFTFTLDQIFLSTLVNKSIGKIVQSCFVLTVAKKFDIPTLDLKVHDDSKTEIDENVFELLLKSQNLGVLEICLHKGLPNLNGELMFVFIQRILLV